MSFVLCCRDTELMTTPWLHCSSPAHHSGHWKLLVSLGLQQCMLFASNSLGGPLQDISVELIQVLAERSGVMIVRDRLAVLLLMYVVPCMSCCCRS